MLLEAFNFVFSFLLSELRRELYLVRVRRTRSLYMMVVERDGVSWSSLHRIHITAE